MSRGELCDALGRTRTLPWGGLSLVKKLPSISLQLIFERISYEGV